MVLQYGLNCIYRLTGIGTMYKMPRDITFFDKKYIKCNRGHITFFDKILKKCNRGQVPSPLGCTIGLYTLDDNDILRI